MNFLIIYDCVFPVECLLPGFNLWRHKQETFTHIIRVTKFIFMKKILHFTQELILSWYKFTILIKCWFHCLSKYSSFFSSGMPHSLNLFFFFKFRARRRKIFFIQRNTFYLVSEVIRLIHVLFVWVWTISEISFDFF